LEALTWQQLPKKIPWGRSIAGVRQYAGQRMQDSPQRGLSQRYSNDPMGSTDHMRLGCAEE